MKRQIFLDSLILAAALTGCFLIPDYIEEKPLIFGLAALFVGGILFCLQDFIRMAKKRQKETNQTVEGNETDGISELFLLSEEEERVIKKWELTGKVSLLIGKNQKDSTVDVDLGDTEYGALVDLTHCVLNYAGGSWYVEDLNSKNGIRIRKGEDGICYKIAGDRPCKVGKGDILLVANTKLLLR